MRAEFLKAYVFTYNRSLTVFSKQETRKNALPTKFNSPAFSRNTLNMVCG